MRINFFDLDERLVGSGSREVERPAFRGGSLRLGLTKCFKIFQKRVSSRKVDKPLRAAIRCSCLPLRMQPVEK